MEIGKLNSGLLVSTLLVTIIFPILAEAQDCRFSMDMGSKYDKCSAICEGRGYKCIADGTCLCLSCPNGNDNTYVHTLEDVSCEFTQECSRKCMDANTEPEYGGNIGRGKQCDFVDDFYGSKSSVCVCTCL